MRPSTFQLFWNCWNSKSYHTWKWATVVIRIRRAPEHYLWHHFSNLDNFTRKREKQKFRKFFMHFCFLLLLKLSHYSKSYDNHIFSHFCPVLQFFPKSYQPQKMPTIFLLWILSKTFDSTIFRNVNSNRFMSVNWSEIVILYHIAGIKNREFLKFVISTKRSITLTCPQETHSEKSTKYYKKTSEKNRKFSKIGSLSFGSIFTNENFCSWT